MLFILYLAKWKGTEDFARWVDNNRSLVAVLVQIFSHVFGMIQVQALCMRDRKAFPGDADKMTGAVVKLSFRLHAAESTVSLDFARFISAISIPRAVWQGRGSLIFVSALIFASSLVPGAIWSGAITPEIVEKTLRRSVPIADFSTFNASDPFGGDSALGPSPWLTEHGLFSFDSDDITDLLINAAREASVERSFNNTANSTFHSKLDNTGFSFIGRSFGGGSAAGLVNVSDVGKALWYWYEEPCIMSNVNCFKNASANFTFYDQLFTPTDQFAGESGANFIAVASGTFPNGTVTTDQWHNGAVGHDLFAMASQYESKAANVMITTGATNNSNQDPWAFAQFNTSQCAIDFQASSCSVMVNLTEMSIQVYNSSPQSWPIYGDAMAATANHAIAMLSTVDNAFGGSRLGRSLVLNTRYLRNLIEGDFSATNIPDDIIFASLSQYLTSILDNELVALHGAQLVGHNASKSVSALVGVKAVQYGSAPYIYAILIINMLILLVCAIEAIRTKSWTHASSLDFTDISQVVLSTSKGGNSLYHMYEVDSMGDVNRLRFALEDSPGGIPALIHAANSGRYTKPRKTEQLEPHLLGLELQEHGHQRSISSQDHFNSQSLEPDEVILTSQSSASGYEGGQHVKYRPSW